MSGIRIFRRNISVSSFASLCPRNLSAKNPHKIKNLVEGEWSDSKDTYDVYDPITGDAFIQAPYTRKDELTPFIRSLSRVPKSGLHNVFKNPERFVMYGQVMQKAAQYLHNPEIFDFFTRCIQRTMPKSHGQATGELKVLRNFCENFSGDNVRFMMKGFSVPGDHVGQQSNGYRWPYGPVAVISPYNFPLEIPIMQMLGAVMVGNKVVIKTEATQGLPVEQFLRFLHACGMPLTDVDMLNTRGDVMTHLLENAPVRMLQFTGSSKVASKLNRCMEGRIRVEDAGFDWKILGGDVTDIDYVAWQCDRDAYDISGQKCSAQSLLAVHSNWLKAGLFEKLQTLAAQRTTDNLTSCPVLSHSNQEIQAHVDKVLALNGSKILFGGKAINDKKFENRPAKYGLYEPTAIFVPLESIMESRYNAELVTTEIFGPLQIVTEWCDSEEHKIVGLCEAIPHHLTAAVVSSNQQFIQYILSNTVNGTTYAGIRARTTGAPQNHWFGPAGDACGAGIGTKEAILHTWTCHREVIYDHGPVPLSWNPPELN